MEKNETQKKQINELDYIDIFAFIRAYLRLASRHLLLACPIILCLIAGIAFLSRVLVKEHYIADASFVVGVTLTDDFSYNYTLSEMNEEYVVLMSDAFQSVIWSEYMHGLLRDELGRSIPGDINWKNAYGTNMGGIYVTSDSLENATQLRDAVIICLPKALFTTLGDIELKVLERSERTEVSHEYLKSPIIWVGAGVGGGIFIYLGIIFLITLWRHDIETSEDMQKITDLPCLGRLPKSRKTSTNKQSDNIWQSNTDDDYFISYDEFRRQLVKVIEQHQVKKLLFTGGYKKRGQEELLDKLNHDWISQGKKVQYINMDVTKASKTMEQIREEMNLYIEESLGETDLLVISGPGYEKTMELLTMADCVDGIVYIVKAGYDQIENTEEAINTLGFSQAELLGYVITA